MNPNTHEIVMTIEPQWGGVNFVLHCSWSPADPDRPCWPHDEYSKRYEQAEAEAAGCVYIDWMDNSGIESLSGEPRSFCFAVESVDWSDGEAPMFELGALVAEVHS